MSDQADPYKAYREAIPDVTPEALIEWRRDAPESFGLVSEGWANVVIALLDYIEQQGKP